MSVEMTSLDREPERVSVPKEPPTASERPPLPVLRIEPTQGWAGLQLGELWRHRELLVFLAWRDVRVRYKQTAIGAAWAVLQPFLTMVVFTVFLGRLAKVPSDGLPYPIFAYSALVPWGLFATGLTASSNSIVGSSNLVKKVYFPRLVIPIAPILSATVDFVVAFVVLLAMMAYYGIFPGARILFVPVFMLMTVLASLAVSLWLAALNVKYRDVRHAVPFLVQIWMFATPIAYPSSLLTGTWKAVYALNPMVGIIEGFRWALLGTSSAPGPMVLVSTAVSLVVLVLGTLYFRRAERSFADLL